MRSGRTFTTAGASSARLAGRAEANENQQVRLEASVGVHIGMENGYAIKGENTVPQESLAVDGQRMPCLEPDGNRPGTYDADGSGPLILGELPVAASAGRNAAGGPADDLSVHQFRPVRRLVHRQALGRENSQMVRQHPDGSASRRLNLQLAQSILRRGKRSSSQEKR